MRKILLKLFGKTIRSAFNSAIISFHVIGADTKNEILDRGMEILEKGYAKWTSEFYGDDYEMGGDAPTKGK